MVKTRKKIIGKTGARPDWPRNEGDADREDQPLVPPLNTETVAGLKYFSNIWKSLDLSLINWEIELEMKWTGNYGLIEEDDNIKGTSFTITSTKIYVSVVTLSVSDNIKFLKIWSKDLNEQFLGTNIIMK